MLDIKTIDNKADVIVNGYAFIREECHVRGYRCVLPKIGRYIMITMYHGSNECQ